ncbi:MAG: hypothetical protein JWN52_1429 [Actinomycetia bacterium]|nr:hypothetical protein [Actinomycetes bacterium]
MRRPILVASALAAAGVIAIPSAAVASPTQSSTKTGTSGALATTVVKREPGATWKKMSIRGQHQQKSNWCGPAAAATVLTEWDVPLRKDQQKYFASKMGTDRLGFTSPIAMSRELTRYINAKLHVVGTKYSTYRTIKNDNLWDAVRGFYNYGSGPPILLVSAKKSWYPHAASGVAHYVVVYGYYDTIVRKERQYLVWDPDYGTHGGTRKLNANNWEKIAYVGRIVVAPKQWV